MDCFSNAISNLLSPLENKYISGTILLFLIITSNSYIPHPLVPKNILSIVTQNKFIGVILTLILAYLLTGDINVALIATVFIYTISHITQRIEGFETTDYVNLLVNEYNYDIDKMINKNIPKTHKMNKDHVKNNKDNFVFNQDNLRFLNYDNKKLKKFQQEVFDDSFTGNNVQPILE